MSYKYGVGGVIGEESWKLNIDESYCRLGAGEMAQGTPSPVGSATKPLSISRGALSLAFLSCGSTLSIRTRGMPLERS